MHPHLHSPVHSTELRDFPGAGASRRAEIDNRIELGAVLVAIAAIGSEPLGQCKGFGFYLPLVLGYVLSREHALWPAIRRAVPALPVLTLLALGLPFSRAVDSWLEVSPVAGLDQNAWMAALSLFLRALSAVLLLSTLVKVAGFAGILAALRRLGLPLAVILTLQHLERYRALIAEEWRRTNQAREARSPGDVPFAFASYANQTALIFLRSWERGERIHSAMLARGFRIDAPIASSSARRDTLLASLVHSLWLPALALLIRLAV